MVDLFVFAGQSNMMGAAHLPPIDNPITTDSFEYKYQAVLKGGDKGEFVYAQNPAGDWHYINPDEAYGEQYLDIATGKSKLANYSSTMHFIPACRDQTKGFSSQSEHQNYPSATMAPYFAQYYSELGRKCIYAHMAKGSCKITHYFTEDAMEEYKLKLQTLWSHLQTLGFTHFFILRVGFWGSVSVKNEIQAQTDFCKENENCHIITRAPSLIPHPSATTDNWWINEPSEEYANCRDSYLENTSNHHFNEKAHKIFAKRSADNINRILHLGLSPIIEEENIKGME